jgi:hypothetical protein
LRRLLGRKEEADEVTEGREEVGGDEEWREEEGDKEWRLYCSWSEGGWIKGMMTQ